MREHADRRDDLAAYALGALGDSEARAIEAHLGACSACSEYLRRLWPAVGALATSVPRVAPPAELRERLLATVRDEAEQVAAGEGSAAAPRPRRRPGLRALLTRPAAAVGAAAILIGGAAIGYALHGAGSAPRSVVAVHPMPGLPSENVAASLMEVDGEGMLRVRHLPAPDSGRVYEVWAERHGVMRPASTFVPRRDGTAMAAVPNVDKASAVFVTEEPRGGSAHPTSPPLMRAEVG